MTYWRTNEMLATWADIFATEILNMINIATEQAPNIPGVDPRMNGEAAVRDAIIADAEYFMSMDPGRLEQELNDQMRASVLIHDDSAIADVQYVKALVAPSIWIGTAATAFHNQMTNIETFIAGQQTQTILAAQAAGMMLAVSVQFRESFFSLMDVTTDACQAISRGQSAKDANWKGLFVDIIGEARDLLTMKTPTELTDKIITTLIDGTKKFVNEPVPSADAGAIIDGYLSSRDRLKKSYENNVDQIRRWLVDRQKDFHVAAPALRHPLPPTTDVDRPEFSYSMFEYVATVPGVNDTSVERERKQYVDEKPKPGGVISQRLSGEGES